MGFCERRFLPLCLGLLAVLAAAQVTSIVQESQTWDEAMHLAAGYSYLKTGDYRMNPEHPPLGKLLNALPLLMLNPRLPIDHASWAAADELGFGYAFLYGNRVPADTLLLAARLVTILLTVALGTAVALWTRRRFGAAAALLALFFCCLDANLIAHGRYVTSDLVGALFVFLSVVAWVRYLETRRGRDLAVAGLTLGLALASKFSCLFLVGVLLVLCALRRLPWRQALRASAVACILALLVVAALYGPANARFPWKPVAEVSSPHTLIGKALRLGGDRWHLPMHPYATGVGMVMAHSREGHDTYLLGKRSQRGWWYYFPVVFAVKTPLAVLLLTAPAAWWTLRAGLRFEQLALAVPMLAFFALSMMSNLNLGVRHILPVYPFLYILMAVALVRFPMTRARMALPAAAVALGVYEAARIHPHYLAFFNLAAGGPEAGPRYLVDSNIDWGQDALKLRAYLRARDIPHVCISYFGNADFGYYGIGAYYLPRTDEPKKIAALDCVAAASVTPLYGLYVPPGAYDWLRALKPTAKIGYSIYLYDLRKKKTP